MTTNENRKAALFMVLGMAGFAINDAFIKSVLVDLPFNQAIAIRGIFASSLIIAVAATQGVLRQWRTYMSGALILRMALETFTTYVFLSALMTMPFANVSAILMVTPLGVTLAAAVVFGERVGWRRYGAILVGFMGVLLVLRPSSEGNSLGVFFALTAVCTTIARDLVTRKMPKTLPSLFVACGSACSITLVASILAVTQPLAPVSNGQILYLACAGLFIFAGYFFTISTVRIGDVGAVAPFRYSALLFAIALGWLFFDEIPVPGVIFGSLIIVLAGLYSLKREQRQR